MLLQSDKVQHGKRRPAAVHVDVSMSINAFCVARGLQGSKSQR